MNNNPFETITSWLVKNDMTSDERRQMRTRVAHYAITHPVKTGFLSPYLFRSFSIALASLVIVLGGSAGVTAAASRALPNESLYSIKLFVEDFRAKNQKTPSDLVAFETKRIETRFHEASILALNHELDDANSKIIQAGIEHSRATIKNISKDIQTTNPTLALQTVSNLETTFSSNSKILATIERNTHQNIGTMVLAAQVATKNIGLEKVQYEQVVAVQPNDATKIQAEEKLKVLKARLAAQTSPGDFVVPPLLQGEGSEPVQEIPRDPSSVIPEVKVAEPTTTSPRGSAVAPLLSPSAKTTVSTQLGEGAEPATLPATPEPVKPTAIELIAQAEIKIAAGNYSEALVLLGQAEQLLDEVALTKTLEDKLDLKETAPVR